MSTVDIFCSFCFATLSGRGSVVKSTQCNYFFKPVFFFCLVFALDCSVILSDVSPVVVEKTKGFITILAFERKRIRKDLLRALAFGVYFFSKIDE